MPVLSHDHRDYDHNRGNGFDNYHDIINLIAAAANATLLVLVLVLVLLLLLLEREELQSEVECTELLPEEIGEVGTNVFL